MNYKYDPHLSANSLAWPGVATSSGSAPSDRTPSSTKAVMLWTLPTCQHCLEKL